MRKIGRSIFTHFLMGMVVFYQAVVSQVSIAQVVDPSSIPVTTLASEYFVGKEYGRPLVSIILVGGVAKPGIYHVPMGTNLVQLLAYAGGPTEKADLEDISVRRGSAENQSIIFFNLKRILSSTGSIPSVNDGDVVNLPLKLSIDKSLTWVNLISGVVSIGLSIAIIRDLNRR